MHNMIQSVVPVALCMCGERETLYLLNKQVKVSREPVRNSAFTVVFQPVTSCSFTAVWALIFDRSIMSVLRVSLRSTKHTVQI